MKIFLTILIVVLLVIPCLAKDKELTLTWTQTLPAPNDLRGWNIYASEVSGGPYRFVVFIPYSDTYLTYSWTFDRIERFNFKKKANMYFVIPSVDSENNVSVFSAQT